MTLGRRTVLALLLALVCINVLLRLPRTGHETGVDSFFIHELATSITEQGRASWVINPLGYFGWYPLSYPSAGPLLISGLAQVSDTSGEGAILALDLTYAAIGALGAFVMGRAFRRDDLFAFTVALIFSLAPRFMSFTLWSASTRNLFTALMPIFLWALVQTYRRPKPQNYFVLISVLVVMLATHRLTILIAVVVIAFVMAYVFVLIHRVARIRFPKQLLARATHRWIPRLTLVSVVLMAAFMLLATKVLGEYKEGEICKGGSTTAELCNLAVSMTRSVGLALMFAFVGVLEIVRRRNKGFLEAFLVIAMLSLVPTLFLRQYTGFYILPFVAIFGAYGVLGFARIFAKSPHASHAAVVACLVAVAGVSGAIMEIEVQRATWMSDANYTTGLFVRYLPPGNVVSNDGLMHIRIAAISGRGGLPLGGAGTTHQSAELLVMGVVDPQQVFDNESRIALTELTIEHDSPFTFVGINAINDWIQGVLEKPVLDVSQRIRENYSLRYFIEKDDLRNAYVHGESVRRFPDYNALFPTSIHATRYKIYDGSTEDVYLAFPPL